MQYGQLGYTDRASCDVREEALCQVTFTADVAQRLEEIYGELSHSAELLRGLDMRLFGSRPEAAIGTKGPSEKPSSATEDINQRLASLRDIAASLRVRALDLSNRI
jgi:hypothetical protein